MIKPQDSDDSGCSEVVLYYSRIRAVIVLLVLFAISGWVGYLTYAALATGHVVLLMSAGVTLVFAAPLVIGHMIEPIRALRHQHAIVIIDAQGVTDHRKKDAFLAWEDIRRVSLGDLQPTRAYLIFHFRSVNVARQRLTRFARFVSVFRRMLCLGDWHVNLRPLRCKPADVLREAKRLRRLAIRSRSRVG
jgi:hypothetical protein